jgi:hypothetical protein
MNHINSGWPGHPEYGSHLDAAQRQWETGVMESADHLNEVNDDYRGLKKAIDELNKKCWGAGLPNGSLQKNMKKLFDNYNKIKGTLGKISNPK